MAHADDVGRHLTAQLIEETVKAFSAAVGQSAGEAGQDLEEPGEQSGSEAEQALAELDAASGSEAERVITEPNAARAEQQKTEEQLVEHTAPAAGQPAGRRGRRGRQLARHVSEPEREIPKKERG